MSILNNLIILRILNVLGREGHSRRDGIPKRRRRPKTLQGAHAGEGVSILTILAQEGRFMGRPRARCSRRSRYSGKPSRTAFGEANGRLERRKGSVASEHGKT